MKRSLLLSLHRRACRWEISGIMMSQSCILLLPPVPAAVSLCCGKSDPHSGVASVDLALYVLSGRRGRACCNPMCSYGLFLCTDRPYPHCRAPRTWCFYALHSFSPCSSVSSRLHPHDFSQISLGDSWWCASVHCKPLLTRCLFI